MIDKLKNWNFRTIGSNLQEALDHLLKLTSVQLIKEEPLIRRSVSSQMTKIRIVKLFGDASVAASSRQDPLAANKFT